jgi:adenine phosphoribosyltransferase
MFNSTEIKKSIRTVLDHPIPGIQFRDITSLLEKPWEFKSVLTELTSHASMFGASCIVGVESRGFVFGTPIAEANMLPLILARKPGKLPNDTYSKEFKLEYGETEIHIQKISPIQGKVVIVDDLIATGGTALACADLVHENFGIAKEDILILAVIDLPELDGTEMLEYNGYTVQTLIEFEGE